MSSNNWIPAGRNRPCPKCNKSTWCRQSADGEMILCQRFNDGTGLERTDRNGQIYWLYPTRTSIALPFKAKIRQPQYKEDPPAYSAMDLDFAYRFILDQLTLSPSHRENSSKVWTNRKSI